MHVPREVTPWLWENQLSSHYLYVSGCVCQGEIPCQVQGSSLGQVGYKFTQFFDGFLLLVGVRSLSEVP